MRQYLAIKGQHADAILFFRMGDFYEMFFEDAVVAARELDLTLTTRDKNAEVEVPLCGFPHHQVSSYLQKLLDKGYKVAICDQTEDPKESRAAGRKLVERAVTRVLTPSLVVEEEALEAKEPTLLAAAARNPSGIGLAFLELSTGALSVTETRDEEEAWAELLARAPKELLLPEGDPLGKRAPLRVPPLPVALRSPREFEPARAGALLQEQLGVATLDGFGLAGMEGAVAAAGAALAYARENARAALVHLQAIRPYRRDGALLLDEATRRNLEVFEAASGGRRGSLLGVMDGSVTAMGGRMIRSWLERPLTDPPAISERLDAVGALRDGSLARGRLRELLGKIADLARIVGRLGTGQATPRDLKALERSLGMVPDLGRALESLPAPRELGAKRPALLGSLLSRLDPCAELESDLRRALADEVPAKLSDGGVIRPGFDRELDEVTAIARDAKGFIAAIEARERERTGIASLKVRFNKVFGYYLEVTQANLAKVPADYLRKQTTAGGERFYTPELKSFEEKVLTAEERARAREGELFEALKGRAAGDSRRLLALAEAVAELDALTGLAERAAGSGWERPLVDAGDALQIEAGRHPVIEQMGLTERFVPNDLTLDGEARLLVVTGPNMAGKSTVMRQTALIVLMAQVGSFVPAKSARIGVVDKIFTRVGASDLLSRGQSTFMVEMSETANILSNATSRSLVVIDEIGRGTSTFDGVSIAWAVAEHLHDVVQAKTLFATHYHELTALAQVKPRVRNVQIAVKEWSDKIVFLRKLVEGATSKSYGIQVARLAGLPESVLARAKEVLSEMTATGPSPRVPLAGTPSETPQLSLFHSEGPLRAELLGLDLDNLTPLEALAALARLKEKAEG